MSDDRFKYHPPTEAAAKLHDNYRELIQEITEWVENCIPDCRETSLAKTKLEEAMFWGNAAIAREISAKAQEIAAARISVIDKEISCPHNPEETKGAIGMYHCPDCGVMVLAGLIHPNDAEVRGIYGLTPYAEQQAADQ